MLLLSHIESSSYFALNLFNHPNGVLAKALDVNIALKAKMLRFRAVPTIFVRALCTPNGLRPNKFDQQNLKARSTL